MCRSSRSERSTRRSATAWRSSPRSRTRPSATPYLASTPDLVGQPLRGEPGRGARRRDRARIRTEQRRRRGAAPRPQHVPVVRPDVPAAGCTRGPAVRRGPQLRAGLRRRLLRRHPQHLHGRQTKDREACGMPRGRPASCWWRPSGRVPAAPSTFTGVGQRMLQADVTMNGGANTPGDQRRVRGARHDRCAAPATSLPVPLAGQTRAGAPHASCAGGSPSRRAPRSSSHPVDSELHGAIAHVTAYRPLTARRRRARGRPGHGAGRRPRRHHPPRPARSPASWARSRRPRAMPTRRLARSRASLVASGDIKHAPRASSPARRGSAAADRSRCSASRATRSGSSMASRRSSGSASPAERSRRVSRPGGLQPQARVPEVLVRHVGRRRRLRGVAERGPLGPQDLGGRLATQGPLVEADARSRARVGRRSTTAAR